MAGQEPKNGRTLRLWGRDNHDPGIAGNDQRLPMGVHMKNFDPAITAGVPVVVSPEIDILFGLEARAE